MILYYENSVGQKIDLLRKPYRAVEADVFDSSWSASGSGYKKKIEVDVFPNEHSMFENVERLYDVLAVDSENGVDGKLYVNGTYLKCRVVESKKSKWKTGVCCYVTLTFLANNLSWVLEETKQFYPYGGNAITGFDYNYDFDYDYSKPDQGNIEWNVSNPAPSDFMMVVYGRTTDPVIMINGYPYRVYTSIEADEYMIIDSETQTITKHFNDGSVQNIFNDRDANQSIFKKISPGINIVRWDGTFGFDIVLYKNRREPKWT